MGFGGVVFFGYADFVDWETSMKTNRIPSIFYPIWQTDITFGQLTSFSRLSPFSPGGWDSTSYMYMGSWKVFGENPNGQWKLSVADRVTGYSGYLKNWVLQIMYNQPPGSPLAPPVRPPPVYSPTPLYEFPPTRGASTPTLSNPAASSSARLVVQTAFLLLVIGCIALLQ